VRHQRFSRRGSRPPLYPLVRYDVLRGEFTSYLGGINASNVEFSRNGEGVIYITQPDLVLWLARADGSDARRLTPASMQIANAAGSPDGKWIAFRGRSGGDTHTKIYLMPYTGGPATPLIPEDVEQGAPSWSADSRRIAYGDVPEAFGRSTGSEVIHQLTSTRWSSNTSKAVAALLSIKWRSQAGVRLRRFACFRLRCFPAPARQDGETSRRDRLRS
jgi:Tol biopolymer transport system component